MHSLEIFTDQLVKASCNPVYKHSQRLTILFFDPITIARIGLGTLCWHNFEHNSSTSVMSIILSIIAIFFGIMSKYGL